MGLAGHFWQAVRNLLSEAAMTTQSSRQEAQDPLSANFDTISGVAAAMKNTG